MHLTNLTIVTLSLSRLRLTFGDSTVMINHFPSNTSMTNCSILAFSLVVFTVVDRVRVWGLASVVPTAAARLAACMPPLPFIFGRLSFRGVVITYNVKDTSCNLLSILYKNLSIFSVIDEGNHSCPRLPLQIASIDRLDRSFEH